MGNDLPVCREFEKTTDSTVHTKIWSLCYLVILKSVVDGTKKHSPSLFYSFFFSFLSLNILNSGIMCYFVSFSGASRHIFLLRVRQPLFPVFVLSFILKKAKKTKQWHRGGVSQSIIGKSMSKFSKCGTIPLSSPQSCQICQTATPVLVTICSVLCDATHCLMQYSFYSLSR